MAAEHDIMVALRKELAKSFLEKILCLIVLQPKPKMYPTIVTTARDIRASCWNDNEIRYYVKVEKTGPSECNNCQWAVVGHIEGGVRRKSVRDHLGLKSLAPERHMPGNTRVRKIAKVETNLLCRRTQITGRTLAKDGKIFCVINLACTHSFSPRVNVELQARQLFSIDFGGEIEIELAILGATWEIHHVENFPISKPVIIPQRKASRVRDAGTPRCHPQDLHGGPSKAGLSFFGAENPKPGGVVAAHLLGDFRHVPTEVSGGGENFSADHSSCGGPPVVI
jgi:hypothetical protein